MSSGCPVLRLKYPTRKARVPSGASNHPSNAPVTLAPNCLGGSLGSCCAATTTMLASVSDTTALFTMACALHPCEKACSQPTLRRVMLRPVLGYLRFRLVLVDPRLVFLVGEIHDVH